MLCWSELKAIIALIVFTLEIATLHLTHPFVFLLMLQKYAEYSALFFFLFRL